MKLTVPTLERWVRTVFSTMFVLTVGFMLELAGADVGLQPLQSLRAAHYFDWGSTWELLEDLFESRDLDYDFAAAGAGLAAIMLLPISIWAGRWSPKLRNRGLGLFVLAFIWIVLHPQL